MKLFRTVDQYEYFVWNEVFKTDIIRQHPFYSKLIRWVINNRTPAFFEASSDWEFAHFSQYFGLCLMRKYDNPVVNDMYYLHDFAHMLFYYPMFPQSMSFESFARLAIETEYVASNETEILAYKRTPNLRSLLLQDQTILYDLLERLHYNQWSPASLLELRKGLASSSAIWALFNQYADEAESIRRYMFHVKTNWMWCSLWYSEVPYIHAKPFWTENSGYLSLENYGWAIKTSELKPMDQPTYAYQILSNMRVWGELALGERAYYHPDEMEGFKERVDGKIILPHAAEVFNQVYHSKKDAEKA